jgi:quercetin dioxygenase-like cupin family protein
VLWTDGAEAAMLYDTLPGAAVPGHGHRHDEECLMLDGEVFLDDVLLRRFDWQLAPAGTAHAGVATDTGGVVFAHGDLDLDLHPG